MNQNQELLLEMKSINIRKATLDDCEIIASINNEHVLIGGSSMVTSISPVEYFEEMMANFNDRELIECLEVGGEVVGFGLIKRYSDRDGYKTTCETAIYLRPNKMRMGLGSKMKLSLIERCREFGYHHLVAKVFSTNIASVEYNKKLGYEVVGEQKEVGKIDDKWVDVTIMQLIL